MSQTERIIKGAEDLFLTSGIRSITMDDIARHLGMSKKTIYQFFKDKNELVSALTRKKLQEDEDQINDIVANSNNVIEEMMNMNKCSEDIFSRINPVVIHDLQRYHPEAWNDFQKFKAEFLTQKMEELLTKGMGQGYIRTDIDVKIIARMRVNQVELGFNTSIFPVAEFNPWKVQIQFLDHFNYGVCTLEGYKLLDEYKKNNNE
ncbi:TetR/AcrR family transcriptional regulator [Mucilaginibacter sp. CAU 1740]|uniref:TetR/AcrR family transcriptional regulator n=1 Tax=Mucilaginibacter sp. CAU 1740 TaxID=3140365 RepID=UPI00325B24D6